MQKTPSPESDAGAETGPVTDSELIVQALRERRYKRVRKLLARMHPAKAAALVEALNREERDSLWQQVSAPMEGRILPHLKAALARQLAADAAVRGDPVDSADPVDAVSSSDSQLSVVAVNQLAAVREALTEGRLKRVGKLLHRMHPAKVAGLLEALPPAERVVVWSMVETDRAGKVLTYLHDEIRAKLARELDPDDLVAAVQPLDLDDLVDLIQQLPHDLSALLMQAVSGARREQVETLLAHPDDSAGGLMDTSYIEVRADVRIGTVLRYLRLLDTLPSHTDQLMVVDRQGIYQGVLRLSALVTAEPARRVAEVMHTDVAGIALETPDTEVARLFQDHDLLSAPVVDAQQRLVGRITVDDVVDLIREDADRALMQMAGLDDEADMFAPVMVSAQRRAVWLGINLVTAFLASWVIGRFEATLAQLVALAVLMPIVASMGGIAGSQTLTLMIRGLALGQIQNGNLRALVYREMGTSVLNGLLWAGVIALLAVVWFGNWGLGGVLGAAILINLLCAALAGLAIPLVLRRMGIDPALAGGVVLTTVTDVIGFFSFLGLASLLLV
ncbi:magnesium transporter [Hydrogenophaga sp.]|uniref:magnesium transporter n=1 Tax=Hydrogenophaga sp. TaxID=1904254 RepID=UPI002723306E|nr:magnesium transporter [Hydrogenophaga sp.]MDO8905753.1 magnesium transporter [Hydrogenophaga sp.]